MMYSSNFQNMALLRGVVLPVPIKPSYALTNSINAFMLSLVGPHVFYTFNRLKGELELL